MKVLSERTSSNISNNNSLTRLTQRLWDQVFWREDNELEVLKSVKSLDHRSVSSSVGTCVHAHMPHNVICTNNEDILKVFLQQKRHCATASYSCSAMRTVLSSSTKWRHVFLPQHWPQVAASNWVSWRLGASESKYKEEVGTSLMAQSLRLCVLNAGGPGSIPGQGTRTHMSQLKDLTCCN